ncbi:hypothetical protein ACFQY9_30910 [Microvirga aerilata]|uniref:hypothetical protein n=2 Tax=Microvirga aerilata TaxID=670292 RepID=UPI00362E4069
MSRSQFKRSLYSASLAVLAAVGLNIACATAGLASPEDEIARLNRVRANLFEELVKTRAEMATARSELEAALKARDAAEAEVARLRQVTASTNPVPGAETKAQLQQRATTAAPVARRQSVRPAAPAATGSVARPATAGAQRRVARTSPAPRVTARQSEAASRQAAPVAQAQDLPSVLRLQDPR